MKTNLANNIWKSFLACAALLLIGGCTDDPIYSGSEAVNGVKIYIKVPAPSVSQTRAATDADDYYNADGVYLLAFKGEGENEDSRTLLQMVRTSAGGNKNTLYAKVKSDAKAEYIYLVANVENQIAEWAVGTPLATIKEALKMTLPLTEDGVLTSMITPQPMIGYIKLDGGIQENTTIGVAGKPIPLERSTAKISLQNKADNFTIVGANLVDAPVEGYLFSRPDKLADIATAHSGKEGDIEKMLVTPAEGVQNCALYTFESDDSKSTAIVIKATYLGKEDQYFRIDLNTKEAKYALMRNFNYIVTITKAEGEGHDSAEKAIANPASNLEYDINVVDAYSRDIISNGEYYLGVSNSEFYAFSDDISSDEVICTITHNAPEEVLGDLPTTGGIVLASGSTLPNGDGNEQKTEIRIASIPANFTTGTITITLGDLVREITIHRISTKDNKFGALLGDLIGKGYIAGLVEAEKDKEWLRLTTTIKEEDLKEEDQFDRLESADENIRIRVRANMGDNSSDKFRTGYVNLLKKDKVGNARVMIKQPVHDLYTDIQNQAKAKFHTYVGTFHRHNQTGERIIRVNTEVVGSGDITWRARVLSGDFIRLSNAQSEDKGVTRHHYGEGDKTTTFGQAIENLYQVVDGTTLINQHPAHNDIYFRVGLTSTIPSNSVRYGIIGLFVNQENIDKGIVSRYIFVRQGEEADYLMRPKDPAVQEPKGEYDFDLPKGFIKGERDKVVKIAPFNLTEPGNSSNYSDLSDKKGNFCTYPSQAGYLYQTIARRGWWADPSKIPTIDFQYPGLVPTAEWADTYETCPAGYVRAIGDTDGANYKEALAEKSPMRQSLWLYPKDGGVSNTQNFIIGYMADGFYDRQPMWHNPKEYDQRYREIDQPTIVARGSQTAFMGVLSFNPRTLASIFLPMAGNYTYTGGISYLDAGYAGGFYTQARHPDNAGKADQGCWTVDYGILTPADPFDYGGAKFRADNYATHGPTTAYSIRCIRKIIKTQ